MKITSFISESIISAVGWTLLHAIWQGFAFVLIAAIVLYALRRRSSYSRYWVGISTMILQLITSVVTFAVYYQPYTSSSVAPKFVPSAQYLASRLAYAQVALPWYKQVLLFLQIHLDTIVLFWGIGASVLLIRLVGSWVYVQQLRAEGIRLTEPRVQSLFRRIADALQIRQTVHLFESVRVNTPMVIGFIKPVVLLPVGLVTGLTNKQIEAVLAHELAHVKRYDYLVNLLQSLVEVVYFFHPALWWLSVRVREEREHCCDDIAIQVCGDKIALVKALAEVASFRTTPILAMAFASKKGVLLNRVQRILGVSARPSTSNGNLAGVLLVILLTLGVSVYAFQQDEKPKINKAKTSKFSHKSDVVITEKDGERIEMNEVNGNMKLTKVMWKHRQLSKEEVAELQILKEKMNSGQLNLDNVKTEQRDILLRIIEMENGLHDGLKGLGALSAIDFEAMVPNEAELEAITEAALEEAQPLVDAVLAAFPDSINMARMSAHSRKIDSLSRLMEPQHQKMEVIRREMEQYEFKTSELERKMEVLEWKRSKFYEVRGQLLEKRNRVMYQEGQKVKKSEAEVEKELAQFEEQIKQHETQIQQLNQQTGELRQQIKAARQPVEELENQIRKLEEMNEKYSNEMERYSSEMAHMFPPPPPPAAPRARAIRAPRAVASPRSPRPALAPVAPISPKTPPPAPPKKK
jgi:bla regulator protein BlaR1